MSPAKVLCLRYKPGMDKIRAAARFIFGEFGPLIAFGMGGTDVEILGDVHFRVAPLTDRDVDAELLGEVANQRLGLGLTGRDFAARQFPAARQGGRAKALGDQQPGVRDDGTGDHDLDGHRG